MPNSVVIVGAGYIAVELAGVLNGLGCNSVSLALRGDTALRGFDKMISNGLDVEMGRNGINILRNTKGVESITEDHLTKEKIVTFKDGSVTKAEIVLFATGKYWSSFYQTSHFLRLKWNIYYFIRFIPN